MSIRFDDRTLMLLNELSTITGTNTSVIVRGMVLRCVDELIDKSGNWKVRYEEKKSRKDQRESNAGNSKEL